MFLYCIGNKFSLIYIAIAQMTMEMVYKAVELLCVELYTEMGRDASLWVFNQSSRCQLYCLSQLIQYKTLSLK